MYKKQEWNNGTRLDATRLNHIEEGIYECSKEIDNLKLRDDSNSLKTYLTKEDLEQLKSEISSMYEEYKETIERQKKEITALKTKITKLSKKTSEEDKWVTVE